MNEAIIDYWFEHYTQEVAVAQPKRKDEKVRVCSLCANQGRIDTSEAKLRDGRKVGRVNFCICPNGQALRNAGNE